MQGLDVTCEDFWERTFVKKITTKKLCKLLTRKKSVIKGRKEKDK